MKKRSVSKEREGLLYAPREMKKFEISMDKYDVEELANFLDGSGWRLGTTSSGVQLLERSSFSLYPLLDQKLFLISKERFALAVTQYRGGPHYTIAFKRIKSMTIETGGEEDVFTITGEDASCVFKVNNGTIDNRMDGRISIEASGNLEVSRSVLPSFWEG